MPDVVVFDLFDTLVDLEWRKLPEVDLGDGPEPSTVGALWEVARSARDIDLGTFVAALRASDRELRDAYWAQGREIRTEQRFADLVRRLDLPEDGLVEALTAVHVGWIARAASAPAHHVDVLRRLRAHRRLAVCSNFSHTPTALQVLEREGLREFFDAVVISADVGERKPRPEIFERTLDAVDARPEDAWHVGDQLTEDVAGAAPLGVETVWITRRVADPPAARAAYEGPAPAHVVGDLADLEALLLR